MIIRAHGRTDDLRRYPGLKACSARLKPSLCGPDAVGLVYLAIRESEAAVLSQDEQQRALWALTARGRSSCSALVGDPPGPSAACAEEAELVVFAQSAAEVTTGW